MGDPRQLGPLGGEVFTGLDGAFAGAIASGVQLARGSRDERRLAHRGEHLVGDARQEAALVSAAGSASNVRMAVSARS